MAIPETTANKPAAPAIEKIKVKVDGHELEVPKTTPDPISGKPLATTMLQACNQARVDVPHYCYHPKLPVAGNCRMCLVEFGTPAMGPDRKPVMNPDGTPKIAKSPRPAIACATPISPGMEIYTNTPGVDQMRKGVLEFLLINHPLDCPICDEAGECKLQDYAYKYSEGESRFEFEKVRKPKRVKLGPHVMLDTERCIMCSRCIRFCDEVAKKPQLTFTQRGDHVELTTFPGEALDNPYAMNTIDLCPVGALTSAEFRFKARVWEMSSTDTVCAGCARGCNTNMWVRNNEILRLTPRMNEEVNGYWMCDAGRLGSFGSVNAGNRIKAPLVRKENRLVEVGWDEAIAKAAFELKSFRKNEIAGIGSAFVTNEDNYLFARFMGHLGVKHVDFVQHTVEGSEDNLLIRADKTPNTTGARAVGIHPGAGGEGYAGIM